MSEGGEVGRGRREGGGEEIGIEMIEGRREGGKTGGVKRRERGATRERGKEEGREKEEVDERSPC